MYRKGSAIIPILSRFVNSRENNFDLQDEIHIIEESTFASRLISKNLKIRIHKTIILLVLKVCETFENKILRQNISAKKGDNGKIFTTNKFIIHTVQII